MSSSFGRLFRVTTFGESHCKAVGGIIDGCPPNMDLDETDMQTQLDRRRPGTTKLGTDRRETDQAVILSGVENGKTLGTPIGFMVKNKDQIPGDYGSFHHVPRPSHADYTYQVKYGIRASSGGGRSSARETIGRVAAGAVAEKILAQWFGTKIVAWVSAVGTIQAGPVDMNAITRTRVDASPIRCPDETAAKQMEEAVVQSREKGDSLGGVVTCVCVNVPPGLGEPVFDKMEALLAHAMLSIPATKGFEIGSGFSGAQMAGSKHNDLFVKKTHGLGTAQNFSGGIQGGISNGEPIYFRVAFKPPATIGMAQKTVDFDGNPVVLEAKGRHDPCVVPRALPIVESMAALVLADLAMIQKQR